MLAVPPTAPLGAQDRAAQNPVFKLDMGVQPGRLRFAIEEFTVEPGAQVELTLRNNDEMMHNLLICKRGKASLDKVAAASLALGARGMEQDFVPQVPEVLWHTKVLMPGKREVLRFRAPTEAGDYPYICTVPGHTFTMRGVMRVGKALVSGLRYSVYHGNFDKLPDFDKLQVEKQGEFKDGHIDIDVGGRRNNYALRIEGRFHARKAGIWRFFLDSDDGSRLFVNGAQVIDRDGMHGMDKLQKAELQLEAGAHSLRLDYFQARHGKGLKLDLEGPGLVRRSLCRKKGKAPRGIPIMAMKEPVLMRVHVEGGPARSIACGLPESVHFVFDAARCCVAFAWAGAFLDVGPDRLGRGGRPCKLLGPRFEVGGETFAFLVDGEVQKPRFLGYRPRPQPEFRIGLGDARVSWRVAGLRDGSGLRYRITTTGLSEGAELSLRFADDGSRLRREGEDLPGRRLEASAAAWRGGIEVEVRGPAGDK